MKEQPKVLTTAEAAELNQRPQHVHRCPGQVGAATGGHEWSCSSAYCESQMRRCPDCGGNAPFFDL